MTPLRLQTSVPDAGTPADGRSPGVAGTEANRVALQPAAGVKRKLLFLITQFDTGGAQAQLLLRLQHIDRSQYDVTLCLLTNRAGFLLERVRALGIRVVCAHLEQRPTTYARLAHLRRLITEERPDVVTGLLCWDHTYGLTAAVAANVPLVIAELHNEREAVRRAFSRGFRLAEVFTLSLFADLVVGCSDQVRRSYVEAWPWISARALAVRNAIDTHAAPHRLPTRGTTTSVVIGTLGRLLPQKNHKLLLEAAALVRDRHPHARFLVAGDGPLRPELEQQAAALGLTGHVEFTGETRTPYQFLSSLDLFVMSSDWEGLPLVAMEAMACGVPVVATNVGGVSELVSDGNNGLLTQPGDAGALADALGRVIQDEELRAALGAGARATVREHFDIRAHVRQWQRLYDTAPPPRSGQDSVPARGFVCGQEAVSQLTDAPRVKRILLFRLCPQPRIARIVSQLRERHPGARLDVVSQDGWGESMQSLLPDGGVTTYGSGPFSLAKLGWRHLRKLRRASYDLVVLPYNLASEDGYRQAELAACFIGRGRVQCYAAWADAVYPLALRSWATFPRLILARHLFLAPAAWIIGGAVARAVVRRLAPTRRARSEEAV